MASPKQKGPASSKHARLVVYRVTALLNGIGATFHSDVSPETVGRHLAEQRAKGMSVQTSNNYVKDAKAFLNWMLRTKRAAENPIACLAKQQVTARSRKQVRRALEPAEGATLLRVAQTGRDYYGMTGEERYWLYRLALETALRSSELRALTPGNLRLDNSEPFVWLPGDDTKNREPAEIPLRPDTAAELRIFLGAKPASGPVFPMPGGDEVVRMLRRDLKAAGIPYETDSGVADFHALRGTCLSWLAAAGVPLKSLQTFARHSTPNLTMNVYTHTLHGSLADAASRLPNFSRTTPEVLRATGTDDAVPEAFATAGNTEGRTAGNGAHGASSPCAEAPSTAPAPVQDGAPENPCFVGENERVEQYQSAREWMGIEPTRRRANDASTALKAAGPTRRPDTPSWPPDCIRFRRGINSSRTGGYS